jgi:hypothetical protein
MSCTCSPLFVQASRRQQEEQEKLLRDFELRRRIRSTVVPTDGGKVRAMLRALGEPITLFGEREVGLFFLQHSVVKCVAYKSSKHRGLAAAGKPWQQQQQQLMWQQMDYVAAS